jgi:glycosyltransferase involved in cell wall biosynthesis
VRILISASAARMGGARTHVLGLVPELAAIASDDEVLLLAQPALAADLPPLPPTWTVRTEQRALHPLQRLVWEQRALPRLAERWSADVLLSFGSFLPLHSACPTVLEAGNALPFTAEFWRVLRGESRRKQLAEVARWNLLRASLNVATRVLAPTRAMRQDVLTRLPWLGERIDVATWGVSRVFHASRWADPQTRTILGVSKHGINKEFDVLIRAVAEIPDVRLVLTGTPDESPWSRRSADLARALDVSERVCFVGDVPNERIPELMCQASMLVFPTWCESFGLPLAEALAMGAPAVAADIPACREVGLDAARYYRAGDAQSLATQIGALLDSPRERQSLSDLARVRGENFTWRDNAVLVRQSLERAA